MMQVAKTHSFISGYRQTFKTLYADMCKIGCNHIVAIARKAPRIFDMFEDITNSNPNVIVISDRAIPYLDNSKVKDVAVFDDIVIFGSTMNDKMKELRDLGINPHPFSLAYSPDEVGIGVSSHLPLQKEHVANFSDDVVSAIQTLGKPYDIDHPIFIISNVSQQEFEVLKNELQMRTDNNGFLEDLTTGIQREYGIQNLVYSFKPFKIKSLFNGTACDIIASMHKIRIFYNIKKRQLIITPISLFQVKFTDLNAPIFDEKLDSLNKIIEKASKLLQNKIYGEKLEETLFRLILYLVEYIYGRLFIESVNNNKFKEAKLSSRDCHYVFGQEFGNYLLNMLSLDRIDYHLTDEPETVEFSVGSIQNKKLFEEIFNGNDFIEINSVLQWSNLRQTIWNICRLLQVKDIITRKPELLFVPNRLKFGFNFEDLLSIANNKLGNVQAASLSITIDELVDRGVLVPLYLKYPTKYWVRAFRFGEALEEERRAWLVRLALGSLFSKLKTQYIFQTEFEKFFAYLIQVLKKSKRDSAIFRDKDFNLELTFDEFGARPVTEGFKNNPKEEGSKQLRFLIQEAIDNRVVELHKSKDGNRVYLDSKFHTIHNKYSNPISSLESSIELYSYLWSDLVDAREKNRLEYMLCLTTCNNTENFVKTYENGIKSWFEHDNFRFSKILTDMKYLFTLRNESPLYSQQLENLKNLLHENAQRLTQSENKEVIWEKKSELIKEMENGLNERSYPASLWKEIKVALFDTAELKEEEKYVYAYLQRFFVICNLSTNIVRSLLKERKEGDLNRYLELYNDLVNETTFLKGLSKITNRDPDIIIENLNANYSLMKQFYDIKIKNRKLPIVWKELEHDLAIFKYDIDKSSVLGDMVLNEITGVINLKVQSLLRSMSDDKYFHPEFNDAKTIPLSSVENALRIVETVGEELNKKNQFACFALHFTDQNTRFKYQEDDPTILAGKAFGVCATLCDHAETIQTQRSEKGTSQHVIFVSKNAYEKIPLIDKEKMLTSKNSSRTERREGKSEIEYWEINPSKLREKFGPGNLDRFT